MKVTENNLNIKDIENLIPQKAPFVMVDTLLHFDEKKVVAAFTILTENILTSNGLFTEPGIIEHMAQTVALHTGYNFFLKNEPTPVGYIGAIKMAEIFELPPVGAKITTTAIILHEVMGFTMVSTETQFEGRIIATAELKTVLAT